jgi:osmoprotectant transport system permease protein
VEHRPHAVDRAREGIVEDPSGAGDDAMNLLIQGIAWLFDPTNWKNAATGPGLGTQLVDHLVLTALSLLVCVVIALPLGLYIGHTGKGRTIALVAGNASRALPTLGLLSILVVGLDIGIIAPVLAFVLLGIPPLLAGAYAGVESVDPVTVDSAKAQGMTPLQVLLRVELPLAAPLIVGGLRSATLQIIATVTIAPYVGYDSLGTSILNGLATANYIEMIGGSVFVTVLAIAVDLLFAALQRFVVPRGVSRGTSRSTTTARRTSIRPSVTTGAPVPEGN